MKIWSFLKFLDGVSYPIKTKIEKNSTEVTL